MTRRQIIGQALSDGKTPADIARELGVTRQAVCALIDATPSLKKKWLAIRRERAACTNAKLDAAERARLKRLVFKMVITRARQGGMPWASIGEALLEPKWKRLQALTRNRY